VSHRAFEPELVVTKVYATDYFHQTNKAPKKKARQQILAHLKELGDTEVTDIRVINWFNYQRHSERKRPSSHSLSTSAPPGSDEKAWVDARHKSRKLSIPIVNHFISILIRTGWLTIVGAL